MMNKYLQRSFSVQKRNAKQRGIEWHFSFEEWLLVWSESGKLNERGRGKNSYVMARYGDEGPYAKWNVYICTHSENATDSRINHPRTYEDLRDKAIGTGRGYTFIKRSKHNPYQVSVCKQYVGSFPSIAEAEAAYILAVKEIREFGSIKTRYTRQPWRVAEWL